MGWRNHKNKQLDWSGQLYSLAALHPGETIPDTHCEKAWVGPAAGIEQNKIRHRKVTKSPSN
jgi:hypothetical protein